MKSLAMVARNFCSAASGTGRHTGVQRFSFGHHELSDGIGFIVVAVGVFGSAR